MRGGMKIRQLFIWYLERRKELTELILSTVIIFVNFTITCEIPVFKGWNFGIMGN